METNFFGAVKVTREFLPILRAQRRGAIVNISSLAGQLSTAGLGSYSASKFALEGMSEALAHEMKPFGIKVLIVEPGAFRTAFAGKAMRHMPVIDAYERVLGSERSILLGIDERQEGDPLKAARAIEIALEAEDTPLRLPLGRNAVSSIRAHAKVLLAELAKWESVAAETEYS